MKERGFTLEVKIDEEGRVHSNIQPNHMNSTEIISFMELQKFAIINSIIKNKDTEIKAEIIND